MANVEPPVEISRSATAVGAVTIETLAFERSELLVAGANEPDDTLALERGELGEPFVHRPSETLALERGELGVAFAHHPSDTLALERGELGEPFAHRPSETLALERGELGVAFAHHPSDTLALERGELGRPAHAALADAALLAIKSRHTQRRAAYGDGCCRQTNRYVTHHDGDTPLLYFRAPQPFASQTQPFPLSCSGAA